MEIDGNSLHFIDTETEDSEEYDSDLVLSPRKKAVPIESLEEMFLKHEFSTFTLNEQAFEEVKPWIDFLLHAAKTSPLGTFSY